MELRRDVTFEEDVAYRRSRRINSDSDNSQELLASPSTPAEKETMEDDIIEPTDPIFELFQILLLAILLYWDKKEDLLGLVRLYRMLRDMLLPTHSRRERDCKDMDVT